jgi:hypothetical protein
MPPAYSSGTDEHLYPVTGFSRGTVMTPDQYAMVVEGAEAYGRGRGAVTYVQVVAIEWMADGIGGHDLMGAMNCSREVYS